MRYKVKMKPPRSMHGQVSQTIPELIRHLRGLCSGMEADPALTESAKYLRQCVAELETARRAAFEVYQECQAARAGLTTNRLTQDDDPEDEDSAEWLRSLQPASPLKQ